MIDERLQDEYTQKPTQRVELPDMTEEQMSSLVDWARTCLQEMMDQDVYRLSSLNSIPVPSQFVGRRFPIERELLDAISGGFSNCLIDVHIKMFSKAFAQACIDNYRLLILVHRILPHKQHAWDGFHEGIAELYNSRGDEMRSTFHKLAKAYAEDPCLVGIPSEEREYYLQEVAKFRTASSILTMWSYGRAFDYVHCRYHGIGLFSLALQLDIDLGIELLEIACLPPVCEMVLTDSRVLHDRQVMFEILAKAPSFVAATKNNQLSGVVAPFVLGYYLLHVQRITEFLQRNSYRESVNPELEEFKAEEAPQLFGEVAKVILDRNDAKYLGFSWLCHLSKSFRGDETGSQWSAKNVFRDVLIDQMKAYTFKDFCDVLGWSFPTVDEFKRFQELGIEFSHDNIPTIHALIAALSVEINDGINDHSELVDAFEKVLFSSTSEIYFSNEPSYVGSKPISNDYVLGALIARTSDPARTWAKLWEDMAAVRFRLRHTPYERDGIPDDANRYLPMVAIAAFDWLTSSDEGRLPEAAHLWEVLWEAVYGSWLNSMRGEKDIWAHFLLLVLVRRTLLCERASEECANDLRPYLLKLGYAPRLVSAVACSLKSNVAIETMESLRPDIKPLVTAFLRSEKRETVKEIRYPALAEACRSLYS